MPGRGGLFSCSGKIGSTAKNMNAEENLKFSQAVTRRTRRDGFETFVVRTAGVEVAVVPKLGAKVVSLRNLRTGREWLYHRRARLKLFSNKPGNNFSSSTVAGWDECLPTIAPCQWQGHVIPDHGEVWSVPWELDEADWRHGVIRTSVRLPVSPLQFVRTIELQDNILNIDYSLINLSEILQEFLWAMHPLLALQEGDELELSAETRRLLQNQPWVRSLKFDENSAGCAKAYAGPLQQGCAGVLNNSSGDCLSFSWDSAECNTLGIWLTRGGWYGHHHLALEPANGATDALSVAAESKRCGRIAPHGEKRWNVQIEVAP